MPEQPGPLTADRRFFTALLEGCVGDLDGVLADDFILIEVMGGAEITKAVLLAAVGCGELKFESIHPAGCRARVYQSAAVVTGRTEMKGSMGGTPFSASSRYTHVFVEQEGRWRMVSAQGTRIVAP